jgi:hypothetical protein
MDTTCEKFFSMYVGSCSFGSWHSTMSADDFQNYLSSLACFSNLMIEIVCKEIMKVPRLSSLLLLRFLLEIHVCTTG